MTTALNLLNEALPRDDGGSIARRLLTIFGAWIAVLAVSCIVAYFVVGTSGHGASKAVDLSIARFVARDRTSGLIDMSNVVPVAGLVLLIAIVLALLARIHRTDWPRAVKPLVAIAVSGVGAYGLSSTLKEIFTRPRPPTSLAAITDNGFSFPSSHSTVGLALLVTLVLVTCRVADRRMQMIVLVVASVLAVMIPTSRLVLGVHWSTDVVIGAVVGATWGAMAHRLITRPSPMARPQRSEQPSKVHATATTSDWR